MRGLRLVMFCDTADISQVVYVAPAELIHHSKLTNTVCNLREGLSVLCTVSICLHRRPHGPLTSCVKLGVAHAPGMHHCTCVTRVPWCMSGSLMPGETFPAFPAHAQRAIYVSGKRPMECWYNLPDHATLLHTHVGPLALTNDKIYGLSNVNGPASRPL